MSEEAVEPNDACRMITSILSPSILVICPSNEVPCGPPELNVPSAATFAVSAGGFSGPYDLRISSDRCARDSGGIPRYITTLRSSFLSTISWPQYPQWYGDMISIIDISIEDIALGLPISIQTELFSNSPCKRSLFRAIRQAELSLWRRGRRLRGGARLRRRARLEDQRK